MPLASFKQSNGYFVLTAALPSTNVFAAPVQSGSGGDAKVASPAVLTPTLLPSSICSSANIVAGTLLKDMGKTVISSSHVYRKVQAVVASNPANNGLAAAPSATGETYCSFYIELANGTVQAKAAPVAYLPGLMM